MAFQLHRRKSFPAIFAFVVLALYTGWYLLERSHPELLLTGIGAVAGFAYFLYRQQLDETRLFKEMFVDFNGRYDKLNNDLNKILDGPKDGLLSVMERDTAFKYFNLCAEEYLFHKAGYIDDEVWKAWEKGMTIFFSHPRIERGNVIGIVSATNASARWHERGLAGECELRAQEQFSSEFS
jgi:hypothetical protein